MRFFKSIKKRNAGTLGLCAVWALSLTSVCCAQAAQAPAARPTHPPVRTSFKAAHSATKHPRHTRKRRTAPNKEEEVKPPVPSDAAPTPAAVSLQSGRLTVDANNSDLGQILREVADISGMTIDGLNKSARVFGAYGPGNPRDVLTDLLVGSGYNFIMAGDTTDGAPRELILTAQNNTAPVLPTANPGPVSATPQPDTNPAPPDAISSGPPAGSQATQDDAERIQQNLDRLQLIHDQQQQQAAPQ